jgi:hypothetical protein
MKSTPIAALVGTLLLGAIPVRADAPPGDCTLGDECYRTSRALLQCKNYGWTSPGLVDCVCGQDPTWDRDVLDCTMCWARQPGWTYEEGVGAKAVLYVSCGPSPVPACDAPPDFCRPAWEVINTCGGYGEAQKDCICNYYWSWEASVESIGNCTGCLFKEGATDLANALRGWYDWRCETRNGYVDPLPLNTASGMPVPLTALASLLLLWVVIGAGVLD